VRQRIGKIEREGGREGERKREGERDRERARERERSNARLREPNSTEAERPFLSVQHSFCARLDRELHANET